jgi:hypothetical protein
MSCFTLLDKIDDIKQKITSGEYLNIMTEIAKVQKHYQRNTFTINELATQNQRIAISLQIARGNTEEAEEETSKTWNDLMNLIYETEVTKITTSLGLDLGHVKTRLTNQKDLDYFKQTTFADDYAEYFVDLKKHLKEFYSKRIRRIDSEIYKSEHVDRQKRRKLN